MEKEKETMNEEAKVTGEELSKEMRNRGNTDASPEFTMEFFLGLAERRR